MKIVVFGPDKRTGAWQDGKVIDLSDAYAKYLAERENVESAIEAAAGQVPADLTRLIEGGAAALEKAQQAVDYVTNGAADQNDPRGENLVHAEVEIGQPAMSRSMRRTQRARVSPAPARTS